MTSNFLVSARHALISYFWPSRFTEDRWQDTRVRIVCGFSLIIGIAAILNNVVIILATNSLSNLSLGLILVLISGYFLIPGIILKTRNTALASTVLITLMTVHCNILILSQTDSQWHHETYLIGPSILGLLLQGRISAIFWAVVSSANLMLLAAFHSGSTPEAAATLILVIICMIGGLSIFQSELAANARQLVRLREDAQRADDAKSDFLANMSHEIRTPMNGISGVLQLLDETPLTSAQKELIKIGQASGNSLLRLINDVLDYSKIAANGITLENIAMQTEQIVAPVTLALSPQALENQVSLSYKIDPDLPDWIMGDPTRLRQVLTNLVGNAVKFSANGTVRVRIEKQAESIMVTVTDSGIGMTADSQARIFEKFEQADAATSRHFGGTGLGLTIAKELIELQGGAIGVSSTLGEGSRFWFTFPLAAASVPAAAPTTPQSSNALQINAGNQVLVVEDNRTNQLIVKRFLESMGFAPVIIGDGTRALELCAETAFHLILMDIQLPDISGVEVSQILRRDAGPNQQTPIVALSANTFPEQTAAYLRSGIDACLGKPFRKSELADVIDQLANPQPRGSAVG